MYKQPKDKAKSAEAALDFFKWALEKGQAQASKLDYVPLPRTGAADRELHRHRSSSERRSAPMNAGALPDVRRRDQAAPR